MSGNRTLRERLNHPIATLLITALVYLVFLAAYLPSHKNRISYLVRVGTKFAPTPSQVSGDPYIHPNIPGYDGQFFYRLALDPFSRQQTAYGMTIDGPAYRQQRIGYSLLVRAVSLGRPGGVARALVVVNFGALCALAWLGASYARTRGRHALWGLLLSLTPSGFMVLVLDTAELVAVTLVVLGLRCIDRRQFGRAALWCCAAALTRETMLILPLTALAAVILARILPFGGDTDRKATRVKIEPSVWFLLAPFAVYGVWGTYLTHVWGATPWSYSGGRLGLPLLGMLRAMRHGVSANNEPFSPEAVFHMGYIASFAILGTVAALARQGASATTRLCWAFFAVMAISYTYPMIYALDMDYLRVLTDFFVLGGLVLIATPSPRLREHSLAAMLFINFGLVLEHCFRPRW